MPCSAAVTDGALSVPAVAAARDRQFGAAIGCGGLDVTFPVGALLKLGIAMPDLPRFLEQEQGEQFWGSNCNAIKVPQGSVLWIPFGYIAAPVVNLQGDDSPEYAQIWTVPIFIQEFAEAAATNQVMSAIFAFNKDHFTRKSDHVLWQQRETSFKKFEALFAA